MSIQSSMARARMERRAKNLQNALLERVRAAREMDLLFMQVEARKVNDRPTLHAVMAELTRREQAFAQKNTKPLGSSGGVDA